MRAPRSLILLCLLLPALSRAQAPERPDPDTANPPDLPAIGKWMLTAQGVPSDWLGEIYRGKTLREPINVIIVDAGASSPHEATARLIAAAAKAGYPIRLGHSTGYQAAIGERLYAQLPKGWDDAFSNDIFEINNNHGRVFGPHLFGQSYVFTAAFSREQVDPFRWPGHRFASFNQARDDFSQKLSGHTDYKASGMVGLDNALTDNADLTTGDHDGRAAVLRVGP